MSLSASSFSSLCHSCTWMREIVSGRGSTFLLCRKAQDDPRFAKYPPQPVVRCDGYEPRDAGADDAAF